MRREVTLECSPSEEKTRLNQTVAELKSTSRAFASTEKELFLLENKKIELEASIGALTFTKDTLLLDIAKEREDFKALQKEHSTRKANFRRELLIPPALIREKAEITASIEDACKELQRLAHQKEEAIASGTATRETLEKNIAIRKNQLNALDFEVKSQQELYDSLKDSLDSLTKKNKELLSSNDVLKTAIGTLKLKYTRDTITSETLDKEATELLDLKKKTAFELTELEKKVAQVKQNFEDQTVSIISLHKRENAVKLEEARLKKFAQKCGLSLNFS